MKPLTTAKRVLYLLHHYPETRSSDKVLILRFLEKLGIDLTEDQVEVLMSVNLESITRARRKIQEDGRYPATPEVQAERQQKAGDVRQIAPRADVEQLTNTIERGA